MAYRTYIRTTAKKFWSAITKPEFARQNWAGLAAVSDWKKGSPWQLVAEGDKPEVYVTGKVLECDPPKRLVLSWAEPENLADKSRVTLEIEPIKDLVRLNVTHDDFKAGSSMSLAAMRVQRFHIRQLVQSPHWAVDKPTPASTFLSRLSWTGL